LKKIQHRYHLPSGGDIIGQRRKEIDPLRQAIADSWPNSLDDSAAREEWGWKSEYDLESMSQDMIQNLKK
jgi:nucleoside-diphosphate-sugar epimerase